MTSFLSIKYLSACLSGPCTKGIQKFTMLTYNIGIQMKEKDLTKKFKII